MNLAQRRIRDLHSGACRDTGCECGGDRVSAEHRVVGPELKGVPAKVLGPVSRAFSVLTDGNNVSV